MRIWMGQENIFLQLKGKFRIIFVILYDKSDSYAAKTQTIQSQAPVHRFTAGGHRAASSRCHLRTRIRVESPHSATQSHPRIS